MPRRKKLGGARPGAGRPRAGANKRAKVVRVLLTPAEHARVEAVAAPAPAAAWARDQLLAAIRGSVDEGLITEAEGAALAAQHDDTTR